MREGRGRAADRGGVFKRQREVLPAIALIEFLQDNENMEWADYHGELCK